MLQRLTLGLLLAAALATSTRAQGLAQFDGKYVGELTLTGVVSGDCTTPPLGALYPLFVSHGQVRFAYIPRFSTTLYGMVAPNGSFKATARVKSGLIQMTGQIRGINATATLASPSCRYTFQTKE